MKCHVCKGACCEVFELDPLEVRFADLDHRRWFGLHALELEPRMLFECCCTELAVNGSCSIYDSRPQMCRDYPAGGSDCLKTVKDRRTAREYKKIRDDQDPVSL